MTKLKEINILAINKLLIVNIPNDDKNIIYSLCYNIFAFLRCHFFPVSNRNQRRSKQTR